MPQVHVLSVQFDAEHLPLGALCPGNHWPLPVADDELAFSRITVCPALCLALTDSVTHPQSTPALLSQAPSYACLSGAAELFQLLAVTNQSAVGTCVPAFA